MKCANCGTQLSANAELCVSCFRLAYKPCRDCRGVDKNGRIFRKRTKKLASGAACPGCDGSGWVRVLFPQQKG